MILHDIDGICAAILSASAARHIMQHLTSRSPDRLLTGIWDRCHPTHLHYLLGPATASWPKRENRDSILAMVDRRAQLLTEGNQRDRLEVAQKHRVLQRITELLGDLMDAA
jgi:hypothetical protein